MARRKMKHKMKDLISQGSEPLSYRVITSQLWSITENSELANHYQSSLENPPKKCLEEKKYKTHLVVKTPQNISF